MTWSPAFRAELKKPVRYPRYRLEIARVPGYLPGAGLNLHSHSGRPGRPAALSLQGASITAGTLHIGDWSYTVGALSVGIRGNINVRPSITRGVLIRLMMGFRGWDEAAYEPVWLGQFQDVRWNGGLWQLQARSITGALITRFTQSISDSPLFHDVRETTLDAPGYTAGSGADINVVSTTGLDKLTGGSYLVQIYPDSGEPFFLTATGKTATSLTGVSSAQLGTTAASASGPSGANPGARVVLCAFLEQHPVEAALTVLTSTGTGNNGPYDLGPASWGFGLPRGYVDIGDSLRTKQLASQADIAGSNLWDIYSVTPQENGGGWLREVLAPGGFWLAERQGLVTVRGAHDAGQFAYQVEGIHDRELVSEPRYSAWDPGHPAEYGFFTVQTVTGSSPSTDPSIETRPAISNREITLPYLEEDEADQRARLHERLRAYSTKVGETFELTCIGWRLAHLCPGDHVIVSSRFLKTRVQPEGLCLVTSVQPDWFGATTTIRCVHVRDVELFG